jgi:hypothetical protein
MVPRRLCKGSNITTDFCRHGVLRQELVSGYSYQLEQVLFDEVFLYIVVRSRRLYQE